jgi:hypothetical protein
LAPRPLGISFNPQRSWASLFRALILPGDRKTLSDSPLRSCAFRQNPYDLAPALQRLAPTQKAVPLMAPQVFSSGRDRCSLELSDLSGSPSADPRKRTSPSFPSPHVLVSPQPYDQKPGEPQGVTDRQLGFSPHYRAPACLAFRTSVSLPPLWRIHPQRTIFSSRSPRMPCGPEGASLCRRWPPA